MRCLPVQFPPIAGGVTSHTIATHVRTRGKNWLTLRTIVLREAMGLCQCTTCKDTGRLRPATEVDHIVPLWEGGPDALSNLQAINVECHRLKSTAEAARRAAAPP